MSADEKLHVLYTEHREHTLAPITIHGWCREHEAYKMIKLQPYESQDLKEVEIRFYLGYPGAYAHWNGLISRLKSGEWVHVAHQIWSHYLSNDSALHWRYRDLTDTTYRVCSSYR